MNPSILRERLRGIVAPGPASAERGLEVRDPVATIERGRSPAGSLEHALGGAWRTGEHGRTFVVERRVVAATRYGAATVGDLAGMIGNAAAAAPMLANGPVRPPFIFFDLETTGLSGGAGTVAFLVGRGWFDEAGAFVTEQHLLVSAASERTMLQSVAHDINGAGALVTFNGKSFDAPVLDTRYLFHRLQPPCGVLPHVDVLHPARRFWGGVVNTECSLVNLESHVLGARRTGDVAGFEIPARYFHFLRSGDAWPLAPVFEHNRLDLLSLAGLAGRLLHVIHSGPGPATTAQEAVALGRVYARAGLDDRADEAFEQAAQCAPAGSAAVRTRGAHAGMVASDRLLRVEALRSLALSARRRRRYEMAAARWRELLAVPECPSTVAREATEALAIHHEHRARDLAAAKMFALKSLEMRPEAAWGDAVRHRLARIERKMLSERTLALFPSSPLPPSCGFPTSGPRTSS